MIKNLTKQQLSMVSGGSRCRILADGRVYVYLTGNTYQVFHYANWNEASAHHPNIGSFSPMGPDTTHVGSSSFGFARKLNFDALNNGRPSTPPASSPVCPGAPLPYSSK